MIKLKSLNKLILSLITIFLIGTQSGFSQEANVEIRPSSAKKQYFIGDTIALKVTIQINKGDNISALNIPTSKFELVDSISSDTTLLDDDLKLITHKLIVSVYDSGKFYFPTLKFILTSPKLKDPKEYSTDSIGYSFSPVEIDVLKDIKPIKDIEEVEFSIMDYIYYIIGAIILLAIIIGLFFYLKRKKPVQQINEEIIPIKTPLEIATESLLHLKNKNLPQQGLFKQYYTELTDIYRIFIHSKYGIDAAEMTTSEIMRALNSKLADADYKELQSILELSDLVKFAKYVPIVFECEESFKKIEELIIR